ncbi:META domain-containing protein [Wohlfahrtiimonas chitiniclastica]|uniref:META domain-containing protein n=1 Tax=Wohlfahrtiimonas chitiniclastica TaxID=400946 RepID=UPI001BCAEFF5|nr:META domain-containing protein [Wohlfahrtiimonas chitiniclastica]MBS7817375.1 META domain-containing protein [Wohlfahrtiimonas chitiniclastica]MBS7823051.1 META domain-containing protein [Wohlfahrtiimonas chitiniclastica]MBS7830865.1 META domain-containing protein [Wohlfahrtiimonas chitiniclastica]MBS7832833.1 META domain-containing protein [Wohlfahrtiimonas chitiniclastica]
MKKLLLSAAVLLLTAGCSHTMTDHDGKIATAQDLEHHNYVLVAIDGKAYKTAANEMAPNIEFGEKMHLSGAMCNNFFGQGAIKEGVLTAKGMGMTRKFCADATLNQLDQTIGQLLEKGATATLHNDGQRLVLSEGKTQLTFELKDHK